MGERLIMKYKIAIFGSQPFIERIKFFIEIKKDVEFVYFPYSKAEDVKDLIEQAFLCDIYVFSELPAYIYVKHKLNKKRLPSLLMSIDAYTIVTSLFRLYQNRVYELDRISIDMLNDQQVMNAMSEFTLSDKEVYIYSFEEQDITMLDKIVNHHEQLWKQGKIDYVLTSIKEVAACLNDKGIPASCMVIPKLNIENTLKEAKKIVQLNPYQSNTAQIVVGFIRLKNKCDLETEHDSRFIAKPLQQLHQLVEEFGKQTSATVIQNHENQIILIGTKSVLENIQNHYRDFPLLHTVERELQRPVDIGFGLALTAMEAEQNAKLALEICDSTLDSRCYIVNERQDIIGPIGIEKAFDKSKLYQSLIHKARLNNELSYNFINFISKRNNEPFSSHDIASHYKVTKRSAERTINKLLSGEVIKVAGEEKPYLKGRPRKLFKLNQ